MILSQNTTNVYPVSEDVCEIDLNTEIEEYNYDGRLVYRGNQDPTYTDVQVFWLYDDNKRVGLVEHDGDKHTTYWFKDNVFSTLLQEDWSPQGKSVWSLMTEAAYQDCIMFGWTRMDELKKRTALTLITPEDLVGEYVPPTAVCAKCNSTGAHPGCIIEKKVPTFDIYSTLFVDEDGVLYVPPSDTSVYATLRRRAGFATAS